jgi:hypothetical protein
VGDGRAVILDEASSAACSRTARAKSHSSQPATGEKSGAFSRILHESPGGIALAIVRCGYGRNEEVA